MLREGRSFEDAFSAGSLPPRDRAFARAVAGAALRNAGCLKAVIGQFLQKPLPADAGRLDAILLSTAAQLLILKTPPHAAISLAVDQVRDDHRARRFDKLTNAVLRRVSEKGADILAASDTLAQNIPSWLMARWTSAYGDGVARAIAAASLCEAPLDLSVKADAATWAQQLGGTLLPTGSIRLAPGGRVDELPGFADGAWWVQDAAAALPVRLLGDVRGLLVADLCAAPGGKTAQLAAAGARVMAVDISEQRLERLKDNLKRLRLDAQTEVADISNWNPRMQFDAILVDAPCTATGTIRRHPDILHLKRPQDVAQLSALQSGILDAAAEALKAGGRMVYCTCSLEPEEGSQQIDAFLARRSDFARVPVTLEAVGGHQEFIDSNGDLRTLPHFLAGPEPALGGIDGFYAAILQKSL